MTHTRRAVLASVAGLAGCLGRAGPITSPSPTQSAEVTLGEFVHRHSFLHLVHPDTLGVMAPADRQFLFVGINAVDADPPPTPSDFELVAGDRHPGWAAFEGEEPTSLETGVNRDRPYAPEELVGWIGFDLPVPLSSETARIERTDVTGPRSWAVPDAVVSALREPAPEFRVSDFDAPASTAPDEPVEVTFDVENVGQVPGTFRASLNNLGPLYGPSPIRTAVEAGETVTVSHEISYFREMESSADTIRFRVVTPAGSFGHEVTVKQDG